MEQMKQYTCEVLIIGSEHAKSHNSIRMIG
jgi:hypothetical protein